MKFMYVQMKKRGAAQLFTNLWQSCSYTLSGSSPVNHEHQIDFLLYTS